MPELASTGGPGPLPLIGGFLALAAGAALIIRKHLPKGNHS